MNNELWKFSKGYIAGYTENKQLMQRIKRYKPTWELVANYHDTRNHKHAKQYRIPAEDRRQAERMFNTKLQK